MSEAENEDPTGKANLVLLLRRLWQVEDPEAWQDIVWRKFRKKLVYCEDPKANKKATDILGIAFPNIFIQFDGFFFHILAIPEPFFEDRESVAAEMPELRLRQAVLDHEAHISVTVLNYPPDVDEDEAARRIGKMTAALGWYPGTLAVVCPMIQQVRVWDKNIKKALRTEHPVTALTRTPPSKVPVVPGNADDADLKAATEEARRRWPEFAAAFAAKQEDQIFAVKAPFKDGDFTEFMWIKVLKIEDEYLSGVIDNDPVNVKKYKRGTRVRLRIKALSDWMYTDDDDLVGGFTNKALDKAMQARLDKIREEREEEEEDFDDDEDDAEEPAASSRVTTKPEVRPKSSSGLMWILLGVGAVFLLGCGGLGIGLTMWLWPSKEKASNPEPRAEQRPVVKRLRPHGGNSGEHIAREFAEALSRGDSHAAYTCTSPAFQERQTEEQFKNALRSSRVLEGRLPLEMDASAAVSLREWNLRNKGAGNRHPPAVVLEVINDEEGWWVDRIDWKGPAPVDTQQAKSEPPLLKRPDLGPKPNEPKRLRERGGNSDQHIIYDFARALSKKDIDAAYACTTPEFQKQQTLAQFKKAVLDSKILDGPMPLQPEFERMVDGQERRWRLRHKGAPQDSPTPVYLQAKADSLGWWVTRIEWTRK